MKDSVKLVKMMVPVLRVYSWDDELIETIPLDEDEAKKVGTAYLTVEEYKKAKSDHSIENLIE